MAGDSLIDAYLAELDGHLGRVTDHRSVLDEVADHLWEKVDRMMAAGRAPVDAQRVALSEFGDPDLVGRAFASAAHGGVAVPTKFTKFAGWAGIYAAGWVLAYSVVWVIGLLGFEDPELPRWLIQGQYSVLTLVSYSAFAGCLVAVLGISIRFGAAKWGVASGGLLLASHFASQWFASAQGRLFPFEATERYRWPFLALNTIALVGVALVPYVVSRSRWSAPLAAVGLVGLGLRVFGIEPWFVVPLGIIALGVAAYPLTREVPTPIDQPDEFAIA